MLSHVKCMLTLLYLLIIMAMLLIIMLYYTCIMACALRCLVTSNDIIDIYIGWTLYFLSKQFKIWMCFEPGPSSKSTPFELDLSIYSVSEPAPSMPTLPISLWAWSINTTFWIGSFSGCIYAPSWSGSVCTLSLNQVHQCAMQVHHLYCQLATPEPGSSMCATRQKQVEEGKWSILYF